MPKRKKKKKDQKDDKKEGRKLDVWGGFGPD